MKNGDADPSSDVTPEALVALSRAVTTARLLSGVIHELNNSLLVVTGTVELLEARTDLPEAAKRPLERLRTQGQRMAGAIAQVSAFTRPQPGPGSDVDVAELARVAVDLRRFAVGRAGLTIQFSGGPDKCLVHGSGAELLQSILSLIINAETALAGSQGRIDVSVLADADWVVVRVSDNRANPINDPVQLFKPFLATREPSDASGLNLFAARTIAAAHGGDLTVAPQETGASFTVRLPVRSRNRR